MQFDRTHVAIRLRTLSEIGDLALVMMRRYPATLAALAAGAAVWAIADLLLLGWIPLTESEYGLNDEEAIGEVARYAFWMITLVFLQAPAAGAGMTSYLGQSVFEEKPTARDVWRETVRHWQRWLWALGIRRWAIPAMLILLIRWREPASYFWDGAVPLALLALAGWNRGTRPFLPEILLLERCPFQDDSPKVITVRQRSQTLHAPLSSDNLGRFVVISLVLIAMFGSVFLTLMCIRGIAFGIWNYLDLLVLLALYPLSLWAVAYVSVLIRFLNYLDARIRLEGWEVELAIQAEAMRQFGHKLDVAGSMPSRDSDTPVEPPAVAETQA